MAFWGNPITSGSHQIDYFISADVMEHPHRTRMPVAHDPYSEQVGARAYVATALCLSL
jgi:hypothetical protein